MTQGPVILAFDTSAAQCAVAVTQGEAVLAAATDDMARGQAERLLILCEGLLAEAGKSLQDLDAIGVGIGPGNFTGIRISVSAARGLALGLDIPAVGISRFDALRHGMDGACICAINAPRDQVYLQSFDETGAASPPEITDLSSLGAYDVPLIGSIGADPAYPTAVALALLAGQRYRTTTARPAPLYLRPADAAPARNAPPLILS
ncbi:tRNA (adenosine(37)-N6)-threonylcarbamoyltransferase complex dimerization subunit type 1 TsaB [Roseobacter weihaiensis]|uniref:tRNA (adenosine(37)-N6)-threonylcarbamoyltransferase complex dimerization subunit type 1 TsaB n=1 Tax=Roseobacter weihaiensis TaxID=2763262 RepID=UPI001D0A3244|nr:tRNA (adenosine(37)-N6)-threonylcarbamoyltransferase complex dimerization subunit type 1 TsaB [Roseobacter sp. H9]